MPHKTYLEGICGRKCHNNAKKVDYVLSALELMFVELSGESSRRNYFIRFLYVTNLLAFIELRPDTHILDKLKINKSKVSLKFSDLIIRSFFRPVSEVPEKPTLANKKVQNNTRNARPLIAGHDGIFSYRSS